MNQESLEQQDELSLEEVNADLMHSPVDLQMGYALQLALDCQWFVLAKIHPEPVHAHSHGSKYTTTPSYYRLMGCYRDYDLCGEPFVRANVVCHVTS